MKLTCIPTSDSLAGKLVSQIARNTISLYQLVTPLLPFCCVDIMG